MSWTRKLLPRSLRSRLILSFGVLIFFTLVLAGAATVFLLREEQEKNAREKVGLLAIPVAQRVAILEGSGLLLADIESILKDEYSVRILLIDDSGVVVADTAGSLGGEQLSQLISETDDRGDARYRVENWRRDGEDWLLFEAPQGVLTTPNGAVVFTPNYRAVIAVPAGDIRSAWRELLPRLFFAGGVVFLVSVGAAGIIARTVTRPLRRITTASEEMAAGRYDQQIPGYGGDEVGRLALAFNNMSQQVGHSHRTLREFLANVSHELKTPLTSIQGFSQAMIDGAIQKPEAYADAARIINDESQRMRGLVDDLLYISQVDAGEAILHLDYLDPSALVIATRERFAYRAGQSGVELRAETTPAPEIRGDLRRLEQALANIVDNAVRHTPSGGRVTLRSGRENGNLLLSVHNTGSIIPAEALPHLFDRFFQVVPGQARVDGNSGLGLAITREIVEMHRGEVVATSSEDKGTEFVVSLPLTGDNPTPTNEAPA